MGTSGEKSTAGSPIAANELFGVVNNIVTAPAVNILSIPAGRIWVGTITMNCAVHNAAANAAVGQATGVVSFAGAGVIPVTGNVIRLTAFAGANAASGTAGDGTAVAMTYTLRVYAPAANAVQVQVAATITGTGGEVNVSAMGLLQ